MFEKFIAGMKIVGPILFLIFVPFIIIAVGTLIGEMSTGMELLFIILAFSVLFAIPIGAMALEHQKDKN